MPVDKSCLMSHPDIKKLVEHNESHRTAIERAAALIAREDGVNYVDSLKLAADGLINARIKIFISYKLQQEEARKAREIVDELEQYGGRTLKFQYAEDLKVGGVGAQYRKKIEQAIKDAHWFILLLPDPSQDLTWCSYETGFFRGRLLAGTPLICLHHPNVTELPGPIEDLQAVKAEQRSVEGFLTKLFVERDPIPGMDPVSPRIGRETIQELAERIINAFPPRIPENLERTHFDHFVRLSVPRPQDLVRIENSVPVPVPEVLDEATILDSDDLSAQTVFNKRAWRGTWGSLIANIDRRDSRWIEELCIAIHSASRLSVPPPIQATFASPQPAGRTFSPCLHAADVREDQSVDSYFIIFSEEVSGTALDRMPTKFALMESNIRCGLRYRWEVLEPVRRAQGSLDRVELDALLVTGDRILREMRSRGIYDPDTMFRLFGDEEGERIKELNEAWEGLIRNVVEAYSDHKEVQRLLLEFLPINQEFLSIGTRRLQSFVEKDWSKGMTAGV